MGSQAPLKYIKHGGGVLIANRLDIDYEITEIGLIKVQAELLSLNLKIFTGKKLCMSRFEIVGTLGIENLNQYKNFSKPLLVQRNWIIMSS